MRRKDKTVSVSGWEDRDAPVPGTFPGPASARAELRVAVTRTAYAELTAHAKESLDKEGCGVLVGHVRVDADG